MKFKQLTKEKLEQIKGNLNSLKEEKNRNESLSSSEKLVDLGYKEEKDVVTRKENLETLYKEYEQATLEEKEQIRMKIEHYYGKVPYDFSLHNEEKSQGKSR